jgi:hypothetical protein
MAKPLSEKSRLIREAIEANPGTGNTEIATLLNGHEDRKKDKLEFKAADVGNQRVALKKASGQPPAKRKAGRRTSKESTPPTAARPMPPVTAGPLELIERVFALADALGGMGALKRLVDRMADRLAGA